MEMEIWLAFLQDRWFIILITIFVIMLLLKVLRTMVKWVFVLVLIGALVIYGMQYDPDRLMEVRDSIMEEAMGTILGDAESATYEISADGQNFTIHTRFALLHGEVGSDTVIVKYRRLKFEINIDERLGAFIAEVRQSGSRQAA